MYALYFCKFLTLFDAIQTNSTVLIDHATHLPRHSAPVIPLVLPVEEPLIADSQRKVETEV